MTDYILTETSDPLITVLSGDTVTLAEGESYLGEVFGVTDGSAPVSVQIDGSFSEPAVRDDYSLPVIDLETTDPLAQGHSVVIGETGSLSVSSFGAIEVTGGIGGSVTNHGTILLAETENTYDFWFAAISLYSPGGHVLNTGTIDLRGQDGDYPSGSYGIFANDNNTVVNEGAIYAWTGIWAGGEGSEVLNAGLIDAEIGIYVDGDASSIVNEGTINTPYSAEFPAFPGVQVFGSESVVRNTGTMTGGGINMVGSDNTAVNHGVIDADYGGILMDTNMSLPDPGSTLRLLNTGLVESAFGGAIYMAGSGVAEFANTGTILGAPPDAGDVLAVVEVSADEMTLVNTGHVGVHPGGDGTAVLMTGGDAAFRNAGTVRGDVEFGDGTDVYDGTGGAVAGIIRMGLGADTATGGAARDVILGGGGGDVLSGAGGRDILAGQAGADTLDGGAGDDLLIGGAGPDVFVFGATSGDDVIADAGVGDRLDLSALGAWAEAEVLAEATETAEGLLIDLTALGGDGSVLLSGVALGDMGGDWMV